ncbi:MAG: type IV pilus assembly protein PilM [Candidatus Hydrogenedentota bacterium]
MKFSNATKVIGLDIGSHSVKAVQVVRLGRSMNIEQVGFSKIDRNLLNTDPVAAHARAIRESLEDFNVSKSMITAALPGQSVVIRYPRLRDVSVSELDEAIEQEASQNIPYDLSEVLLDWSLLDQEVEGESTVQKILLVAAKHDVIDQRIQFADIAGIEYSILSVDSLALADAAEECQFFNKDETVALINIGAASASIHFTKDGKSNFIRDIGWGSKELVQAIVKSKRMDFPIAELLLVEESSSLTGGSRDDDIVDVQIVDEPESSASSAPSLLDPLENEIGLETATPQAAESSTLTAGIEKTSLLETLSTPISRLVTEVRRSFDYYEHQLYEHPVERIILSGGIAHIPLISEALSEELGIDDVTVADPSAGAIKMNRRVSLSRGSVQPAQFMVAVGLAARGLSEL